MTRGNQPASPEAWQATAGFSCVAFFDIVMLAVAALYLGFFVGFDAGTPSTLTLLHGFHLLLVVVALVALVLPEFYAGCVVLVLGVPLLWLDTGILVTRTATLIQTPAVPTFVLLLFDVAFFVTAILYLAWLVRALPWYDWKGNSTTPTPTTVGATAASYASAAGRFVFGGGKPAEYTF